MTKIERINIKTALERVAASIEGHMLSKMTNEHARGYAKDATVIFQVAYSEGTLPIGAIVEGRAIVRMQHGRCWLTGEEDMQFAPHRYIFTKSSLEAGVEQKVIIFVM